MVQRKRWQHCQKVPGSVRDRRHDSGKRSELEQLRKDQFLDEEIETAIREAALLTESELAARKLFRGFESFQFSTYEQRTTPGRV